LVCITKYNIVFGVITQIVSSFYFGAPRDSLVSHLTSIWPFPTRKGKSPG
jgi:hypothetical protein